MLLLPGRLVGVIQLQTPAGDAPSAPGPAGSDTWGRSSGQQLSFSSVSPSLLLCVSEFQMIKLIFESFCLSVIVLFSFFIWYSVHF